MVLIALLMLGAIPACDAGKDDAPAKDPIRIILPSSPDLTKPAPPERVEDGAYTVWGALQIGDDTSDAEIRVVGHVVEVHLCDQEEEKYCTLPSHMLLTDDLKRSAYRLIVTGRVLRDLGDIPVGGKLQLSGIMRPMSGDGRLVSLDGLLVLPSPLDEIGSTVKTPRKRRPRRKKRQPRKKRIQLTKP
jgi:hypothetical protein